MFDFIPPSLSEGRKILMIDSASGFLKSLSGRLDSLVKNRLWLQVIIGLILGIIVGTLLGPDLALVSPEKAITVGNQLSHQAEHRPGNQKHGPFYHCHGNFH